MDHSIQHNLVILGELYTIPMIHVCTSLIQTINVLGRSTMKVEISQVKLVNMNILFLFYYLGVSTFVGKPNVKFNSPCGLMYSSRGNFFLIADSYSHLIRKITMEGRFEAAKKI